MHVWHGDLTNAHPTHDSLHQLRVRHIHGIALRGDAEHRVHAMQRNHAKLQDVQQQYDMHKLQHWL
jgi:hypothetical protein